MRSSKVLEMINSNRIEDLKLMLQDEIYEESLKNKPGAKQRYDAMKRYFTYHKSAREALQKPCKVEYECSKYISFCNSYSLCLTTEDPGEIKLLEDKSLYPDVTRLINTNGIKNELDFNKALLEAKIKGYKLNKTEVGPKFKYLIKYNDSYYKLGLLESTFNIINDGKPCTTYKVKGSNKPLVIKNDIGICVIMPVRFDINPEADNKVVINIGVDNK